MFSYIMKTQNLTEYLRVFRKVVDEKSFSATGRALNMSPAWVATQVTRLEQHLDSTLLIRSTRQLHLTDAGQQCYQTAVRITEELNTLTDQLHEKGSQINGSVRINVPSIFARDQLGRKIAQLRQQHPKLGLDVTVSDHFVDLFGGDQDIVVRIAQSLQDSAAIVRKIGEVSRVLCASPDYLAKNPAPKTLRDVEDHAALSFTGLNTADQWQLSDGTTSAWVQPSTVFRANNSPLIKYAAISGAGLAYLPKLLIEGELKSGALIEVTPLRDSAPLQIYALRAPVKHLPAKVQAVWDFLALQIP